MEEAAKRNSDSPDSEEGVRVFFWGFGGGLGTIATLAALTNPVAAAALAVTLSVTTATVLLTNNKQEDGK